MPKYLPAHEIAALAIRVASTVQVKAPSEAELCLALMKRGTPAQLISDSYTQLWVDMLYIAYSTIDDPMVHYVYITDRHIAEEYQSYLAARKTRKNEVFLPESINQQFGDALRKISSSKKNYVSLENLVVNHSKS